jgi:ankyrin repeat protein
MSHILLANGSDPSHTNVSAESPLHKACEQGNKVLIRLLVQFGGDTTAVNQAGLLCWQVPGADEEASLALQTFLTKEQAKLAYAVENRAMAGLWALPTERGQDQKSSHQEEHPFVTALKGGNLKAIQALIEGQPEEVRLDFVNGKRNGRQEKYPIFFATHHLRATELLLKASANVNVTAGTQRNTPLHLACAANNKDLIKLLVKYRADTSQRNREHKLCHQMVSPAWQAKGMLMFLRSWEKDLRWIRWAGLAAEPDAAPGIGGTFKPKAEREYPLIAAVQAGDVDAVTEMILECVPYLRTNLVNAVDNRGCTALCYCGGKVPRLDLADLLLRNGADPDAKDHHGNTVLYTLTH